MGTNFYYKIPLKKREIDDLKNSVTEDPDLTELKDLMYMYTEDKIAHLGKRSAGWQFLWDLNDAKFYASNLKSIKHFLKTAGGYIVDEYGEKFSIEDFFNDEIALCLYKDETHDNLASYLEKHPEERHCNPVNEEFTSTDGLRFSRHTDFS